MPITVSTARNIRNEPARYMSWLCSAASSIGPVVGSDNDRRHDDRARDHLRQQLADVGDERIERHAQRVFEQDAARRQALCARGHDILLLQLVEQVGAQAPDHAGGARRADHDDRHPEMLEHRHELAPAPGRIDVLRIHQPADRGAERDIGEIEQDQREQEVGRGQAEEAEEGEAVVGPSSIDAWPNRRRSETTPPR